jgi:hypothetical protein
MRSASLCFFILLCLPALVQAQPTKLGDAQLDRVTAGLIPVDPPPVGGHPWQPGRPILNPGGPILISCTIGAGCITRHYP